MTAAGTTTARKTRENRRLAFSKYWFKHVAAPSTGQDEWTDISTAGFGLRVSHKGTRTWTGVVRLKGSHTRVRFTIGRASIENDDGGMTLADARSEWAALKKRIARGEDPRQTEAREKAEIIRRNRQTFRHIAEEFLETHHPRSKKALKPSTERRYRGLLLGPDMAPWQSRPLSSLTRADVIDLLHRMQRRGVAVSANRALAVLRKLMAWAIQQNLIEHSPCDHIQAPAAETPRMRHLFGSRLYNRPSELGLLWHACERVGLLGALPKLLLLTGQREKEVTEIQDRELIDLDGAHPRWHIPGTRTKNGKDQVLPLTPMAVEILRGLPRVKGCPYLFTTTGSTPFSGFTNFKKRIDRELAALTKAEPTRFGNHFTEPWVFHDLRRTFKTGLAELRIAGDVRDALLNHSQQGVDAHYNHAEYEEAKRAAMMVWEQHLREQIEHDRPKGRGEGSE